MKLALSLSLDVLAHVECLFDLTRIVHGLEQEPHLLLVAGILEECFVSLQLVQVKVRHLGPDPLYFLFAHLEILQNFFGYDIELLLTTARIRPRRCSRLLLWRHLLLLLLLVPHIRSNILLWELARHLRVGTLLLLLLIRLLDLDVAHVIQPSDLMHELGLQLLYPIPLHLFKGEAIAIARLQHHIAVLRNPLHLVVI